MPYQVNPVVDREDFRRQNARLVRYLDNLRERGLLIELDNVWVDAEQLVLRTFQCNIDYCLKCKGDGNSREYKGSCCTDLSVEITPGEKRKLVELADRYEKAYSNGGRDPIGPVARRILKDDFSSVDDETNEETLRHKSNGPCTLSWIDPEGKLRCSINTMCDRLGLSLEEFKPGPCYHFPLHYAEVSRGVFVVTLLTEESREWIQQHKAVARLICLRKPEPGAPRAYEFLRGELELMFGKDFYTRLAKSARRVIERNGEAAAG